MTRIVLTLLVCFVAEPQSYNSCSTVLTGKGRTAAWNHSTE